MDEETTQALLQLDEAIEAAASAIEKCGVLVNEGRLEGDVVYLKVNQLAARLMTGGAA
jgi:hypothetical protein